MKFGACTITEQLPALVPESLTESEVPFVSYITIAGHEDFKSNETPESEPFEIHPSLNNDLQTWGVCKEALQNEARPYKAITNDPRSKEASSDLESQPPEDLDESKPNITNETLIKDPCTHDNHTVSLFSKPKNTFLPGDLDIEWEKVDLNVYAATENAQDKNEWILVPENLIAIFKNNDSPCEK